ncbi:MAG: LytTR family DNA-binding domain-containing protein [Arcicella sp.]|nr:LytTR family DNA-binding domain-containing protein [Arcicella sp.]
MNTNPDIHIYLHGKIAGRIIPENVILMEAEVNYTNLHFKNGEQILLCQTLKSLEEKMKGLGFLRIHRKTLLNTLHISHFDKINNSFVLKNGKEVEVSRRKLRDLKLENAFQTERIV